ncbi:MAG: hypothetical protein LBS46_04440 [Dysgonamonadaceae bacterium]|nr:hypothetical protein [Dysgonamonadaceae bacterium]
MSTQSLSFVFAAFLTAVVFSFSSCSEDEGGVSASGKASLRISVAGISTGGEESLTRAALEPETVVLTADDGTAVEFTLSIDPASVTRAPTTTDMDPGKKYRIIVYKASDDSFVTEDVFTAGDEGSIMGLEQDTPYKLVAISYNTATAPPVVGSPATTITVDPSYDLLHWVNSNTVTIASGSPSPTVGITFKHRFPKVTVTADASLTGDNITVVPASATLTPGYQGQLTLLTDGAPAATATSVQTLSLGASVGSQTVTGSSRYVFTGSAASVTLTFSGNLTVAALSGPKTLTNPVVTFNSALLSGYKYTLTIRVEASKGDYYSYAGKTGSVYQAEIPISDPNTPYSSKPSLTFLTYNLGADPDMTPKQQMAYPHTDDKNIRVYGGLFQWGRKDVYHALRDPMADVPGSFTTTLYTTSTYNPTSTSQQFVLGDSHTKGWWLSNDVDGSKLWGNGAGVAGQTTSISAGTNNPCPSGYRVPTQHECALIMNENGNSGSYNDTFNATDNGDNTAYSGATWYVPLNNKKLVWVRVSDKKASTSFTSSKMNGYAIYRKADITSNSNPTSVYNTTFAPTVDLTIATHTPLMFLPAAGYRTGNGTVESTGVNGFYWSSTVQGYGACGMTYSSTVVMAFLNHVRAYGRSVRCIAE